jgi:hypothetical protein
MREIKVDKSKYEIDKLEEQLKHSKELIDTLKSENSNLKSLVHNAGSIVKTSVSAMSYAMKNYSDAPAIKQIENCDKPSRSKNSFVLSSDNDEVHYSTISFALSLSKDEQDTVKFMKKVIYEYKHKHLAAYLGNHIVRTYKKENPEDQSIWNSDTNRLTYLIRDIMKNNKIDWTVDKNGVKTNEYIITPIVNYVRERIKEYLPTLKIDPYNYTVSQIETIMDHVNKSVEIQKLIETEKLNGDILKYIAPHFFLTKIKQTIS